MPDIFTSVTHSYTDTKKKEKTIEKEKNRKKIE